MFEVPPCRIMGVRVALPTRKIQIPPETKLSSEIKNWYRYLMANQTVGDLATQAGISLMESFGKVKSEIGAVVFISRTPDFRSPITAGILQSRWDLPNDIICYDINEGHISVIKGLHIAAALFRNPFLKYAILVFGDSPSKFNLKEDVSQNIVLGDSATVMLLGRSSSNENSWHFDYIIEPKLKETYFLGKGGFRYNGSAKEFDSRLSDNWLYSLDIVKIVNFVKEQNEKFGFNKLVSNSIVISDAFVDLALNDDLRNSSEELTFCSIGTLDLIYKLFFNEVKSKDLSKVILLAVSDGLCLAKADLEIEAEQIDSEVIFTDVILDIDSLNFSMNQ